MLYDPCFSNFLSISLAAKVDGLSSLSLYLTAQIVEVKLIT